MYTDFSSFSLLQQENYGAQNLCYFSHHTFIMLPLYLVKQTLMLYYDEKSLAPSIYRGNLKVPDDG